MRHPPCPAASAPCLHRRQPAGASQTDGDGRSSGSALVTRIARAACSRYGASVPTSDLQGVTAILDAAQITELTRARIAVLDGIKSSPSQRIERAGQVVRTP